VALDSRAMVMNKRPMADARHLSRTFDLVQAAAGCLGALMIIINVLYGVMLCLVSYKHTQDILEENYEQARKRASMVITRFMRASKDAGTRVSVRGCVSRMCVTACDLPPHTEAAHPVHSSSVPGALCCCRGLPQPGQVH
jgi:hypothetical protein